MNGMKFSALVIVSVFFMHHSGAMADTPKTLRAAPNPTLNSPTISPQVQKQLVTKEKGCDKNAKDNLALFKAWVANDCGLIFNGSSKYSHYYDLCMNGNAVSVKERQALLADCICKPYATKAVLQNKERLDKGCPKNASPSVWNSNYDNHYKWCIRGANQNSAKNQTRQRELALKTPCATPAPKTETKKTENVKDVLTLFKASDPAATSADIPYSGVLKSVKNADLIKLTNNTKYRMTFLSAFNSSLSAAKCFTMGTSISLEFKLAPGQSRSFTNTDLSFGKQFSICTDSNSEATLKLDYEYEVTH